MHLEKKNQNLFLESSFLDHHDHPGKHFCAPDKKNLSKKMTKKENAKNDEKVRKSILPFCLFAPLCFEFVQQLQILGVKFGLCWKIKQMAYQRFGHTECIRDFDITLVKESR